MALEVKRKRVEVDLILDQEKAERISQLGEQLARAAASHVTEGANAAAKRIAKQIDELREEGYLTGEKLEGGSTAYSFTNGLLFTITPEETQDNGASVCFSAEKWRSPLGAYYFTKCTASRGDNGWEYTVGAEAIS